MGPFLLNYPDISNADLVFDVAESRRILNFFYPSTVQAIEQMQLTDAVRRLAQTMLVAAVDGTYAMGYIEALFKSARPIPSGSPRFWAQRLVRGLAMNWFKHARREDLMDAKIHDAVRDAVAIHCQTHFRMGLAGELAQRKMSGPRYLLVSSLNSGVWS